MRCVTFSAGGEVRAGALCARGVVDFRVAAPALPPTLIELLAAGPRVLQTARAVMARALDDAVGVLPVDAVRLLAPMPRPGKILGVALNYRDHAAETGRPAPAAPFIFSKAPSAVIGPGAAIELPAVSRQVDFEGELAVIIGRRARRVARADARAHIAGYTIMNDVTARDYQARSGHCLAKSFDTFAPLGPALVTLDEIEDADRLPLRTLVSGVEMQRSHTGQLIFDVGTLIEYISAGVTLEPGDVITTGTPAGVGARRTPPRFLQPGDTVRIEIDGLGVLENPVVAPGSAA
jgi:2-keto-4-pentenoate hydratase/2-oxohepta-3-ene-1,7-dioic acid hydratase in catechol pathway